MLCVFAPDVVRLVVAIYVVLSGGDHDVGHGDDDVDRAGTQGGS